MDHYRDRLSEIVYEQKKTLERYTNERDKCLDGNLAHVINMGKEKYYHTYFKEGKYCRITINKEPDKIMSLARKEYLTLAIEELEHNIRVLEKAEKDIGNSDFASLKEKMRKAYLKLPDEYFFGCRTGEMGGIYRIPGAKEGIMRHIAWGNEPYEKSTYRPEGRKFLTSAGYKVRSKSEQHIVEQLVNYGVPHRYEQVLRIGNELLVPDLTLRDMEMEPFYWEHAGMMDDPYYRTRHKKKIDLMERAGIVPWKNLIITYDNDGVINVPMIKSIIENEVLPRL